MNEWVSELETKYRARMAPIFLLHGNVADDVLVREQDLLRLYEFIPQIPSFRNSGVIAFFNLHTGVRFPTGEMEMLFLELIIEPIVEILDAQFRPTSKQYFAAHKRDLDEVLDWFEKLLSIAWDDPRLDNPSGEKLKALTGKLKKPDKGSIHPFAVVVFEYQESQTPEAAATESSHLDRRVVVALQWWGQLRALEEAGNVVLLITDSLGLVAPQIQNHTKGLIPIQIPFPDQEAQAKNLSALRREFPRKEKEPPDKEIVRLTSGLTARELTQIYREASLTEEPLGVDILFAKKSALIEDRLQGLVELYRPSWGWSTIGGLDYIVSRLMEWAEAMKSGNISKLPRGGFLAVGPPGTGKTACAEAFAHEVDIPFLVVKSTFNPYVGQSEANLELLHETARALAPVTLFIDEIDKLFVPTSDVFHGDSGIFSRFTKGWMEFLSDPRVHGKVFVFAATNRPDLLDDALLRSGRFGAKGAFLIPEVEQKPAIWRALFEKERIRQSEDGVEFRAEVTKEELVKLSAMTEFRVKDGLLVPGSADRKDHDVFGETGVRLTGGDMEKLISMSLQRSDKPVVTFGSLSDAINRYLPDQNVRNYGFMNDLALLAVDEEDLLPASYREKARRLRVRSPGAPLTTRTS